MKGYQCDSLTAARIVLDAHSSSLDPRLGSLVPCLVPLIGMLCHRIRPSASVARSRLVLRWARLLLCCIVSTLRGMHRHKLTYIRPHHQRDGKTGCPSVSGSRGSQTWDGEGLEHLDFWTGLHSEYEQDLRAGQKKKNHSNLHLFARGLIVPSKPAITMEDSCSQLASLTYSPVFSKPPNFSCQSGSRR